jgi:cell division protein FtsB
MDVNSPVSPQLTKYTSISGLTASFSIGRRRVATAAAAMLAVGVGYHVVFGANGLTAFEQKRQETRHLNQRMEDLQRQNDHLKDHVQRLQTDPSSIEQQAREGLRYTRPGEVIYTLPSK